MRVFAITVAILILSACEEEKKADILEGFERLGGEGAIHFVYVHQDKIGDRKAQRDAGMKICNDYGHTDYCEVYMWKERNKVATKLPFHRYNAPMGVFEIKNGRADLKTMLR